MSWKRKKKKNPVSQSLLKAACPGPGDSQVWLGPATPPTPPLARRTASTVLSWERLVESCPAQAAFPNGRRKHRSLSKWVSGSLESLTFCKSFSSLSRGEPYSPGEWVRILESHRIGFEPEFWSLQCDLGQVIWPCCISEVFSRKRKYKLGN